MTAPRKNAPPPPGGPSLIPVFIAVALADREIQERVAFFLRDLAAGRMGMVDEFAGLIELRAKDSES